MKEVEDELKENKKYIQNYYAKSKAHKEFIKKQNEYRKITDIKEQNRLNKLNLKEYHKTAEYKEFNKRTDSFFNSKNNQNNVELNIVQNYIKNKKDLKHKNDVFNYIFYIKCLIKFHHHHL